MSESGSCNNVKVVKPPGIFKELSAAAQRRGSKRRRGDLKEEEINTESDETFFSAQLVNKGSWRKAN